MDMSKLKQDLQESPSAMDPSIKSELESLKMSYANLMKQVNFTVFDTVSADVKSNTAEIQSLKSELVATKIAFNTTGCNSVLSSQNVSELNQVTTKSLVQLIGTCMQTTKSQLSGMSADIKATKQEISAVQNKLNNNDKEVVFQVYYASSHPLWIDMIFDAVVYNIGNSYNESTGIFTAPVSGTYILWANVIFALPTLLNNIYIYKGKEKLATGYPFRVKDADILDNRIVAVTTVDHLETGDQVHFATDSSTGAFGYGSRYGGALLQSS